jgi:hypothetical protein
MAATATTLAMPRGHLASDVGKLSGLRFPAQASVGPWMAQPWVVFICRPAVGAAAKCGGSARTASALAHFSVRDQHIYAFPITGPSIHPSSSQSLSPVLRRTVNVSRSPSDVQILGAIDLL